MARPHRPRPRAALLAAAVAASLGCAPLVARFSGRSDCSPAGDAAVYRAAQDARTAHLEREIDRLHADLAQAEEAMVTIESGLRGPHTRADAVSTVADVRIAVERAARVAPWRRDAIAEARLKLAEAERQLRSGHSGSALFFASRAERIAIALNLEADQVARFPQTRFIGASRANLRSGPSTAERIIAVLRESTPVFPERNEGRWLLVRTPSGPVGWVHDSVLARR